MQNGVRHLSFFFSPVDTPELRDEKEKIAKGFKAK